MRQLLVPALAFLIACDANSLPGPGPMDAAVPEDAAVDAGTTADAAGDADADAGTTADAATDAPADAAADAPADAAADAPADAAADAPADAAADAPADAPADADAAADAGQPPGCNCGAGSVCVIPYVAQVLGEECYPLTDAGAQCRPGTKRAPQFDLVCVQPGYACVTGSSTPMCVPLPGACGGTLMCSCFNPDPCAAANAGRCDDAHLAGGAVTCVYP